MTERRRTFHTFAEEYAANKSEESDAPIEVATDASLDEGAIIRTTAPYGSPLAGPVQYFVGMDSCEAAAVHFALAHLFDEIHDDPTCINVPDFGIEEVQMMRDRVGRLPYFDGKDQS